MKQNIIEKLVPELRFPEFEGEWENKKIESISTVNPKTTIPKEFNYIDLSSVEKGLILNKTRYTKKNAPSRAQRTLQTNDILFQMVRPYQRNHLLYTLNDNDVASTGFAQIRTKQNSSYLYHYLSTNKFNNEVYKRCTGTSYPAINSSDFKKIKIKLPSLNEQKKIASFLSLIDKKIELLQKQKSALEKYKKGLMQKIFSQKIRFKNENENDFPEWEEKKLKEITIINKGKQLNKSELRSYQKYPCINGGIEPSGYTDNFNTEANTITISEGGNSCGYVNFIKTNFWAGGHCYTLEKSKINSSYIYNYLKFKQKFLMRLRVGSGLPNIQKKDLENFKIHYPTVKEQKIIADTFASINKKFNHKTLQIKSIHRLKKSLLQKMFI